MPQPFLNFFQTDTVCIQQTCAAMTKIMETDLPHTVLLQDQREMLCDISGLHKLTDFIDIDIISKLPAIRFSAQLLVYAMQAMTV